VNELAFSISLLDAMFPEDSTRNWKKYSSWADFEQISSLPHVSELDQALAKSHTSPGDVSCDCLKLELISQEQLKEFCLYALVTYFGNIAS
jgi:hypothetical protein